MKIDLMVIYMNHDYSNFPDTVTIKPEIETLINLLKIKKIVERAFDAAVECKGVFCFGPSY